MDEVCFERIKEQIVEKRSSVETPDVYIYYFFLTRAQRSKMTALSYRYATTASIKVTHVV